MLWIMVTLVLLWSSASAVPVSVSCKDELNNDIDWYILYKAPKLDFPTLTGLEYIYIDSRGKRVMPQTIRYTNGVLANTLRPMLSSVRNMPDSFGFLSYSDQPPGSTANSDKFGHSKGVVLGDSVTQTALWLTHSTPQFPFKRDQNNFWPDSGAMNAQTFMCVSLQFSALSDVGIHLQHIRAFPFDNDLPVGFPTELINAANWETKDYALGKFLPLKTKGGKELATMAKTIGQTASDGDLYVKLSAGFDDDVYAQTWDNSDPSYCTRTQRQVLNVLRTRTDLTTWDSNRDHSKWAVAKNYQWTCISDMNRALTQYPRWGGALCIADANVNGFFKWFVGSYRQCPS